MDPLIWHRSMNWIDVCRGPKTCRKSVIRNATENCGVPFRAGAVFDAYDQTLPSSMDLTERMNLHTNMDLIYISLAVPLTFQPEDFSVVRHFCDLL